MLMVAEAVVEPFGLIVRVAKWGEMFLNYSLWYYSLASANLFYVDGYTLFKGMLQCAYVFAFLKF